MISVCSAWAVYEPSEIWQRVDVRLPLIPAQTEGHPARPVKSTSNHHKKHTELNHIKTISSLTIYIVHHDPRLFVVEEKRRVPVGLTAPL